MLVFNTINSSSHHYAFGMMIKERSWSSSSYRFGFNGMEKDDEVKGDGSSLDFGARIYDPRIGRFFSIDPLTGDKPFLSPYHISDNNPIWQIDFLGEDGTIYVQVMLNEQGKPTIDKVTMNKVKADLIKTYADMGVDLKVEVAYSNEVMTKCQFYEREGADGMDSYVLIGDASQLEETNKQDLEWEKIDDDVNMDFSKVNGASAVKDWVSFINSDNVTETQNDVSGKTEYDTKEQKISLVIQHETGHPKFRFDVRNKNAMRYNTEPGGPGHVTKTIMQGGGSLKGLKHDAIQRTKLKELHGSVKRPDSVSKEDFKAHKDAQRRQKSINPN